MRSTDMNHMIIDLCTICFYVSLIVGSLLFFVRTSDRRRLGILRYPWVGGKAGRSTYDIWPIWLQDGQNEFKNRALGTTNFGYNHYINHS